MEPPPDTALDLGRILTEQRNPRSDNLDALSTLDMLRVFNAEDRHVAEIVNGQLHRIASAVDAIAERMQGGGRLFYIGAGTSGRLGVLDASECPPTFNVPPDLVVGLIAGGDAALKSATEASEDDPETGIDDLIRHEFSGQDCLIGIAASGRTPYVLGAVEEANGMGAFTSCIVCAPGSPLAQKVKCPIELLVGPEVITGSTRLKAGTATKLVLNMISSGVMIRLGYVYSNLMVNVQPRNAKLVDRAQRIIMEVTGLSRDESARLLDDAGRNVRIAIVMGLLGRSRAEAVERLAACRGRIREALK